MTQEKSVPADARLLDAKKVQEILSISERTLYRLVSLGQLPKPVAIGRAKRWRVTDIVAYSRSLTS